MNFGHFSAIELNPHWALWIVLPLAPLVAAMIVMLYFQQRRLAKRSTVLVLTAIRLLLVLLVIGLFLRPAAKWEYTRTSAGTLWLLVDQSPSMESVDRQASAVERLHWAEALGYLSASSRHSRADLVLAHFVALRSELYGLPPDSSELPPEASADAERGRATGLAARVSAWVKRLDELRKMAADDPAFAKGRGPSALDALERASSAARGGAAAARSSTTLRDANDAIPWPTVQKNITIAAGDLVNIAAEADAEFQRAHGGDSDVSAGEARVTGVSRSDLAFEFLTAGEKRTDQSLMDLLPKYRVRIASFADSAQSLGTVDPSSFADTLKAALNTISPESGGQSTNIAGALQTVADQIGPDEPASIVVVTDGRHNTPGDPTETARLLAARGIGVYGLLVGSHEVSADAAVDQIDAPEWIFKGDTLKATALLRFDGLSGKMAHVEFHRGEALVDSQNVPINGSQVTQRVDFTDKPPEGSSVLEYEVRITPLPGEVNTENNRSSFRVAVKKDKLYVLMIEDRPRWEYRYLEAFLSRDQRLKLQSVLLNPARIVGVAPPAPVKASPTNSRIEAEILPEKRQEWEAFDLIILGDISADTLSNAQQQFIAAAVREKGATLITIAGQRHMPASLANMPLAELLPVTLNPQWNDSTIAQHTRWGFRPGLAPEGNGSPLGQLALDAQTNSALWSNVPDWYWHSAYTQAKPSASVIWSITERANGMAPVPAEGEAASPAGTIATARKNALLATMSVGLGKSLYLASDQTWRLRQVNGSNVQDRFWGQVLSWAVGSDLPAGGKFVRFGASQPRYAQGQPVTITARVLREDLTPYGGLSFSAVARPVKKTSSAAGASPSTEAQFVESSETPGYYRATLGGLAPGDVEISLRGPEVERLLDTDPTVTQKTLVIKIVPQLDLEQRNMNTDPGLLARVCQAGGGFSLDANYADVLASHLPEIQRHERTIEQVGFFTDPDARGTKIAHWSFIALFTLLLTLEWVIRKFAGLI